MRSWFSPARTRILLIIKKINIQAWQLHFNGGQQDVVEILYRYFGVIVLNILTLYALV